MAEAVNDIALHQPHGAGEMVWPDRFGAVFLFCLAESFGGDIQRVIPADGLEPALALFADAPQGPGQPVRVMDPFPVRRDLGADHAVRIVVERIPANLADPVRGQFFNLEGTRGRTIVRTRAAEPLGLIIKGCHARNVAP